MAGTATKTTGVVLIPKTDPGATNAPGGSLACNFCECAYTEYVFADAGGDAWKNDITSFLFRRYAPGDTVALELWKAGVKVADIVNSDYGQFYNFGDFTTQPGYIGWIADWYLISDAFGFGVYSVKAVQNLQGTASTIESRRFRCAPYDDQIADGTTKLEWWQTGNIVGSAFDYTGLLPDGWRSSIRVPGRLGLKTPLIETDTYTDSAYRKVQIQDSVTTEYTLEARLLPTEIADAINYNAVLGNRIAVTDYSVDGPEPYQQKDVLILSIEPKHKWGKQTAYTFTMQSRTTTAIKRNF